MNCECGCGGLAPVYRGKQCRYLRGHCGAQKARKKTRYVVEEVTGCWIWLLAMRDGYGIEKVNGKYGGAHVHSYEKHRGPVPKGLVLDHVVCGNRRCINPRHLEAVTSAVNTRRGRNAKINQEIADDMRRLKASGSTQTEIARIFGVSQWLVSDVVRGNTWTSPALGQGFINARNTKPSPKTFAAGLNTKTVATVPETCKTVIVSNAPRALAERKAIRRAGRVRTAELWQTLTRAWIDDDFPTKVFPADWQLPLPCLSQSSPYGQMPPKNRIDCSSLAGTRSP